MHIITRKTLRQFWERHPDAAEVLKDWHDNAEHANWTSPRQVKADYPSASITTAPRGGGRANSNFRAHRYGPDHPALADRELSLPTNRHFSRGSC